MDHVKELLGKPLIPTSNDENTLTIQNKLDIKKGHLTIDELNKATQIDPCDTPIVLHNICDFLLFIITTCFRLLR